MLTKKKKAIFFKYEKKSYKCFFLSFIVYSIALNINIVLF